MMISYQLYSSRDAGAWEDTLNHLASLGYSYVEGFGGVYEDPHGFKALLDANQLAMPSGHFFPLASFEEDFDKSIAAAKVLGMERLFCPAPTDEYRNGADLAAWKDLANRLNEAGKRVQGAGLRFGWHNHHWEFMALEDGTLPMQVLLDLAPEIEWEMDVAWVVRGGADPLKWIADHKDRITTAHVKDIAPEDECADEDGWADVGHGVMDWPGLMAALEGAGVDLFVMEHDKPNDARRFAQRSLEAVKRF
ncbi:sugar phosphate isomerase/epimerase [Vannielia litorea]|uniref:sugar phosphate isomerase/epimerase family protein n=1 Tax=Vannielia litorea TaxID=1217970 RepID=UPI001C93E477|nr:sugar phosphate isomerase/epimerase [Vannielia litorea]MBY6154447.1 sugar phosphate isomerase/epimerase [Vannielia litorea]